MSGFNDLQQAHAAKVFCNSEQFGEAITFTPKPGTGSARNFKASIWRRVPGEPLGVLHVFIPRNSDATLGAESVDRMGDKITCATDFGGTATVRDIVGILAEDASGWLVKTS